MTCTDASRASDGRVPNLSCNLLSKKNYQSKGGEMALDLQLIRLTDDHTLESASQVMSALQFDQRIPNGRHSYVKLLKDVGFRSNQNGDAGKQYVFQGQCLILGDARVGKTSLKNSLMGRPFNTEEPRTKGVDISLVDHTWKNLDSDKGLRFGSFHRFGQTSHCAGALYGPGGIEYTFNQEVTNVTSFLYILMRITWVISLVWHLGFSTSPFDSHRLSIIAVTLIPEFFIAIVLHFQTSQHPGGSKVAVLFAILPRFIAGLGAAFIFLGILQGNDCNNPKHSFATLFNASLSQFVWVAMMCNRISVVVLSFMDTYFGMFSPWSEANNSSSLPGQVVLNIKSVPFFRRIFFLIFPVSLGTSFAAFLIESKKMSTLEYCQTLHFIMIPVLLVFALKLARILCIWVTYDKWTSVILFVFMMTQQSAVNLNLFDLYAAMMAAWACHTLYVDWDNMLFPLNKTWARQASLTCIFVEKVALNFQRLKSALCSKFSSVKLKLLDFSGDKEYYAYHHVFMRDHAIYFVVFNLANFADNNFANTEAKIQRIKFWLESICCKVAPKTPIFLVGTHRGQIDKTSLKTVDKHLQQHLMQSFSRELVKNKEDNFWYFPIENTLGRKDKGVQNLQKQIMSTVQEQKTVIGRKIPYSWIKIQDEIIHLQHKKKKKFLVSLKEFSVSFDDFICSNWTKETLQYFHEKGLVIYCNDREESQLSKCVLLNPAILVDIIIQLITSCSDKEVISQPGFCDDLRVLRETGMLTDTVLNNILSTVAEDRKALKGFLEEYDIICPLHFNVTNKEEAQVTHFVPSLLPMAETVKTPVWIEGPDDKKCYVAFHRFLPEPLFQHLLSQAHRLSEAEFPQGQPLICKDVGVFWVRPSQPYRLLQLKDEDMIEVTFTDRFVSNGK